MSDTKRSVPFTKGYVLRTTLANMQRSVTMSLNKTLSRLEEFQGDSSKSTEILQTLSDLNKMKQLLEDFQKNNPQAFAGE
jgi:hypothetical protein